MRQDRRFPKFDCGALIPSVPVLLSVDYLGLTEHSGVPLLSRYYPSVWNASLRLPAYCSSILRKQICEYRQADLLH